MMIQCRIRPFAGNFPSIRFLAQLGVLWCAISAVALSQGDYVIGGQDVLTITVWNQPSLSGKFSVEADGSFTFPLLGRVKAGGHTLRVVEEELKERLADGFLRNPQVSVAVEQYKSQQIFVVGEVRQPGSYPLSGSMTLIEALARAGSTTESAGAEAIVVRPRNGTATAPSLPQADTSEIIRVDIRELQAGALTRNVTLSDGDTVFVPRAEKVYVFGQVRLAGEYAISSRTTVLQALSKAGGLTDRGSTGRVKIVRLIGGKKTELKVKLEDVVQSGDTIIVGERLF
jgi:polysaccharide export outer membrane protein